MTNQETTAVRTLNNYFKRGLEVMNIKKIIGLFAMMPLVLMLALWLNTLSLNIPDNLDLKVILGGLIVLFCLILFVSGLQMLGDEND